MREAPLILSLVVDDEDPSLRWWTARQRGLVAVRPPDRAGRSDSCAGAGPHPVEPRPLVIRIGHAWPDLGGNPAAAATSAGTVAQQNGLRRRDRRAS
jgi:hypothetical protein